MKTNFYLKKFICLLVGFHLISYLSWSFIEMSLLTPFINTFKDSQSRAMYLACVFLILTLGLPFYAPHENK